MTRTYRKPRNEFEVMQRIVECCINPVGKTDLMLYSRTNWNTVNLFITKCIDTGLICREGDFQYLTTGKGREFLIATEKIFSMVAQLNLESTNEVKQ